ncbi:hypothetical protein D8M20_12335, partial [Corynebacterium propinquum]
MLSFIVFILAAQLFIIGTYPLYAALEQVPDDLSIRGSVARVFEGAGGFAEGDTPVGKGKRPPTRLNQRILLSGPLSDALRVLGHPILGRGIRL